MKEWTNSGPRDESGKRIRRPFQNDKWDKTSKFGSPIPLTDFVSIAAFKTPLDKKYNVFYKGDTRFTCAEIEHHYF